MAVSFLSFPVWSFDGTWESNSEWHAGRLKLSEDLVLHCARHDYGTRVLSNTGNLAAVMRTMGHKDVTAAMQYQHPDLEDCPSRVESNQWIARADDRIGKSAARSRTQAKTITRQVVENMIKTGEIRLPATNGRQSASLEITIGFASTSARNVGLYATCGRELPNV